MTQKRMIGRMVTDSFITCNIDSEVYHVDPSHPNYEVLRKNVKNGEVDEFLKNLDYKVKLLESSDGKLHIENGKIFYEGEQLNNEVTELILNMVLNNEDFNPLFNFLNRLMKNPSKSSIDQLWKFITQCKLSITDDGCFLAYKSVRSDYTDKHTGKFKNNVGEKLSMPRRNVDDNPDNHCSYGFHVGAFEYSGPNGSFYDSGDKVVICKVPPEDVVSVPTDYTCQKLRTCSYEVVAEYKVKLEPKVYNNDVYSTRSERNVNQDCLYCSASELKIGSEYTFEYRGEKRTGIYQYNNVGRTYTFYMSPEDNAAGAYRCFHVDFMVKIQKVKKDLGYKVVIKF